MNTRLFRLLSVTAFVAAFLPHTPAGAQDISGTFSGRPSCQGFTDPYNHHCVVKGADNALWGVVVWGDRTVTTVNLGMTSLRNPSCTRLVFEDFTYDNFNHIVCAAVGTDNALYGFGIATHGSMTPVRRLGGLIGGDPSCVETPDDSSGIGNPKRVDAFATCTAVDDKSRLIAIRFNPWTGANSAWQMLGGVVLDNPSCVQANEGLRQVICAVKGTNNSLFGIRFAPQTGYTSGFKAVAGGNFVGSPSCVNTGPGVATCAVRDRLNALVAVKFNPKTGTKSVLQTLGSTWAGDPSCAPANQGLNRVICVGRATVNSLEAILLDPATGFSSLFLGVPGRFASDPSCVDSGSFDGAGTVNCGVRRVDNALSLIHGIAP